MGGPEITTKQLAELAGVTTQAVYKALREGRISGTKIDREWLFSPECAEVFAEKPTDAEGLVARFNFAKMRKLELSVELLEMEVAEKRGLLISREVVQQEFEEPLIECRAALLALPSLSAAELSGLGGNPGAIERRLRELIEEALNRAADQETENALDIP